MKVGGIELGGVLGGYTIVNKPATSLPQELASAIDVVNNSILGAVYEPIWYVGHQLVKGTNYMLICNVDRATKVKSKGVVAVVINIPPGDGMPAINQAKIVDVIEEASLRDEVKVIFEAATRSIIGVKCKPLVFLGTQIVKGINYHFIAEETVIYPGADPRAVMITINVFNKQTTIVGIEPMHKDNTGALGCPLGEWP